jgi:hypothetical protein
MSRSGTGRGPGDSVVAGVAAIESAVELRGSGGGGGGSASISSPRMSLAMAALAAKSATTFCGGGGGGGLVSTSETDPDTVPAEGGLIEWSLSIGVRAAHPGGTPRANAWDQNTGWRRVYDRATVKVLRALWWGFGHGRVTVRARRWAPPDRGQAVRGFLSRERLCASRGARAQR